MSQELAKVDPFLHAAGSTAPDPQYASSLPLGDDTVGGTLRSVRESRGLTLADVSARLKFGVRQLEALEDERWEDLPRGPSLRGLVRNYARLLGLDAETLLQGVPAHLMPAPVGAAGLVHSSTGMQPAPLRRGGVSPARQGRNWLLGFLFLFLISAAALAAYVVFTWWLPRMSGESELAPINLPYADTQQSMPVNVAASGGAIGGNVPGGQALDANPTAAGSGMASADAANLPAAGSLDTGSPAAGSPTAGSPVAATSVGAAGVWGAVAGDPAAAAAGMAGQAGASAAASIGARATIGAGASERAAASTMAGTMGGGFPAVSAGTPGQLNARLDGSLPAGAQGAAALNGNQALVAAPASTGNQLMFQVSADSWVEVRDGQGGVVLYTTLKSGTQHVVDAAPPARVVIGNANGVQLRWKGVDVDLAQHQRGNVARLTLE